jgi:hypothetical protein
MLGQKMLVTKNALLGNFRARLPEQVRRLEKKLLAVVREIASGCARSSDALIRLPTKSASTKRPFHLQHVARKNPLE